MYLNHYNAGIRAGGKQNGEDAKMIKKIIYHYQPIK
mgnify:CR=1 FL=1